MTAQCPSVFRFPCIRTNSGQAGLSAQELAAVLQPFLPGGGTFSGALVNRNTDVGFVAVAAQDITWQVEVTDTDGYFSLAAPTRFTIPADVNQVILSVSTRAVFAVAALFQINLRFNSSTGGAGLIRETTSIGGAGTVFLGGTSAPINVSEGDFFEFQHSADQAGTLSANVNAQVWASIHKVG